MQQEICLSFVAVSWKAQARRHPVKLAHLKIFFFKEKEKFFQAVST